MTRIIKIESRAAKKLKALDKPIKQQIKAFIDHLTELSIPRSSGKAYRVVYPASGATVLGIIDLSLKSEITNLLYCFWRSVIERIVTNDGKIETVCNVQLSFGPGK